MNCLCVSLFIFHMYLNFKAVLVLPKTARSAKAHKSISFIWILWSTLYVYLCHVLWGLPVCHVLSWSDDRRCRLRRRTKLTGDRITVSKKKASVIASSLLLDNREGNKLKELSDVQSRTKSNHGCHSKNWDPDSHRGLATRELTLSVDCDVAAGVVGRVF